MNIFFEIMNIIGNVLYVLFDMLILSGIFILFPLEDRSVKMLLHKSSIQSCNTFCKSVSFDISWKMCEIITIVQIFF